MIENSTCVRFVNYTNQSDFALITGGEDACISKIGKRGGKQLVVLVNPNGGGCLTAGKILHEFLHLLGKTKALVTNKSQIIIQQNKHSQAFTIFTGLQFVTGI